MKNKGKFLRLAAVCALMLCLVPLNAQKQYDNKYYISLWGAAGYANLMHGNFAVKDIIPKTSAVGGGGGLFGVGFEYNHKNFILTFGAEFDYKLSTTKFKSNYKRDIDFLDKYGAPEDLNYDFRMTVGDIVKEADGTPIVSGGMIDTEGDPFVMHYLFTKYTETYHSMYVNVPLLMGAQFASGFYFLMGGKVGLHMGTTSSVNSAYKTRGSYPQFFDDFGKYVMTDHYFADTYTSPSTKNPIPNKNKLDFGLNVAASLEMGKVIIPRKGIAHYRIAAFADYGVLNIHKDVSAGEAIIIPPDGTEFANITTLRHNSLLASNWALKKAVNPLLVGVKFTILLDLGNKVPCVCLPEYKSKWQTKSNNSRSRSISK